MCWSRARCSPQPAELIESDAMAGVIEQVKETYDLVVIDTRRCRRFRSSIAAQSMASCSWLGGAQPTLRC